MKSNKFLKRGDVFDLLPGMKVYTDIPERFVYSNTPGSMKLVKHEVTVGERLSVAANRMSARPSNALLARELSSMCKSHGVQTTSSDFLDILEKRASASDRLPATCDPNLEGEYVVLNAHMGGGGTGMGAHDVYPDGWDVEARKLLQNGKHDYKGRIVSFYQSGCFTAMNETVPVKRTIKV